MIHDSVVTPTGLNLVSGPWGTCINGQTFQQEALVTCNGWQYTSFFLDGGILAVARRPLPRGAWEVISFADYPPITHDDVHNVAVIGISPLDGSIHLSFDHHVHPLRYRRSIPGLATEPLAHAWTAAAFGPVTDALVAGKPLTKVTYPQFFTAPDGRLQFLYRIGYSGNGDWYMAEYDAQLGAWRDLGLLFSRAGTYGTSQSRCAYPNPVRYGADGRLHITWSWRERPTDQPYSLATNHDLLYAWSDDCGRTWCNNAGAVIARLDQDPASAIGLDTPGIVVQPMRFLWGQMNTTTEYVDRQGRVHVVCWCNPDDAPAASLDKTTWCYEHCWRDEQGVWHRNRLPFTGRKPQIAVDPRGQAYVVSCHGADLNYHNMDPGGVLRIATASAASGWSDWAFTYVSTQRFVGEPLLDGQRWEQDGVLSIYVQEQPAQPGSASPLHVLDFQPTP